MMIGWIPGGSGVRSAGGAGRLASWRWLVLGVAVFAAGCAATTPGMALPYAVRRMDTETMTGYRMEGNYVSTPPIPGSRLAINAVRAEAANGRVVYLIEVNHTTVDALEIPPGETLVFMADGERIALSGPGWGGGYRGFSGSAPVELALYEISPDDLRKLAAANRVDLRITGRDRVIENVFHGWNVSRLRAFVAEHVH